MGREYSSDLSGLRDELINGLAALRKEVQKESEKVGRAIGDGYEDGYEDSVEVVRKSKEDLLQELQDLQGAFERNLNKLPTILKKSFQKLDFADLSRVSRRLKTEISEIQNIYGDLSKIGVDINIDGWMDSMLQKANQLSVSLDQQSEIVSDIGKAAEDAANKVKKSAKELSNTIEKTNNSLDNSKTIKSIDDLEKKYFSIIGTVEKYLQLVEKLNKVSGNNSRDLRKQVINFANEMPQDVVGMLGEKFVQQLANGFKGISTKDIIKAITSPSNANAFGALQHKLNLAKSIDFNNIKYTDDGSIKLSDSDNPFEFLKSIEGQLPIVNELYEVLDNIATAKKELGTSGTIEAIKQETEAREQEADAIRKATKEKRKYYEIDEKAARFAKQMRSFDDYKEGSATASYISAVDEMAKIVEEKKTQFPDKSDKLDQWLDKYAKNLATYINRDNQIGAQYPSVMISGAGNYNANKHNRQMASWGKNYQYYDDNVLAIANKIKNLGSAGTNVIRSDESDALEKLEARLEYMKYWHDVMVEVNKYYRKNKTLEGFEGVEPDELERIKKDLATIKQVGMYDVPYPQYAISNDNQNIKRIEGRITELKRLKDNEGLKEENDIYKLWTDKQDMRIRISFEIGKPEQEIIDMLKGKSFKWSPKNNAWQRQLTGNAVYDTKRLQESLHKYYQIDASNTGAVQQQKQLTSAIEETANARQEEIQSTQKNVAAMAQLQNLIGDLKSKYGEQSFNNIFGETVSQFGELNASNATALYDALIAKNEEYIRSVEEQAQKTRIAGQELQTFMAQNQKLANQFGNNVEFEQKWCDLLNQIGQATLNAADATKQLSEWMSSSGLAEAATLTTEETKRAFDGINLGEFIGSYNIDKEYIPELIEDFKELAALIKSGADKDVTQKIEDISNKIRTLGGNLVEVDEAYREFLDYARRTKIKVNNDWIDPQTWNDEYRKGKRISKGLGTTYKKYFIKDTSKLGTGKYAYSGYPDQFIEDLPDRLQFLFPEDRNDGRALEYIINAIDVATKAVETKTAGFTQQDSTGIRQSVALLVDRMENNLLGIGAKNTDQVLSELSNLLSAFSKTKNDILNGKLNTDMPAEEQKQLFSNLRSAARSMLDGLGSKISGLDLSEFEAEYNNIFNEEFNSIIDRLPEIERERNTFLESIHSLPEELFNLESFANTGDKFYEKVKSGAMTSAEAIAALREELSKIAFPTGADGGIAEAAERAADAEERHSVAAGETRKQLEGQKNAQSEISAEAIIERDIEKALSQLRAAKDNETTLINLKGVFSGDDLVEQFSSMVQKIAEQANLSVGKITVKDDIAQVRLYNEELKVTVDQIYQLKQATEEADSAQLELVSQSFSQNVKALNENSFDVDGFRARATAAVEKVRSSLHGLEYDLTDLEKAAENISSKEDFAKFNNQLKAAQDNIQAIKNATVSKSSMNQLANMQRDMKNANIELETMRIKLQKIGDIDGVEDAKKMIDDMTAAAQRFNEAQDAQGQQDAYSKYSASRSSFKAQLEYLNAVKSFNASQASAAKQTVDPIKNQYKSIFDTVNKINSMNSDILKFQEKDAGSGLYSGYIKQLQVGKEQLVAQLQSTVQEIDAALSEGFVRGKEISIPSVKFLGDNEAVSNFLNSTKTQAALTADEIDRLVVSLQKAQSIDVQAAARVVEQFRTVQETYQKIGSLFSLDTNSTMYKNVEILFSSITKYRRMLSSDSTEWTPEQSKYLQTLIDEFNRYGNTLVQVGQKEQQYFAGKQKYTADTSMQSMAEDAKKSAEEVSAAQQKLTTAAQNFAKESGASGAIVTNFVQGADGISRLDFSVLDSGTNSLRKFRMEMGSVSEGTYITETTVNNFVSKTQQAAKQLQTVSDLISRLQLSGANMDNNSIIRLVSSQQKLAAELSKGSGADQNVLSQLTKDAKLSATEVEKLYKQFVQLNNLVTSNEAYGLGKINFGENVREQLKNSLAAWGKRNEFTNIKLASLNEVTGKFKVTAQATDNTVREFTGSLNQLGNSASMQQTKVTELGSKWDRFKTSLAKTGRQLMVALVGYNVFFKAISEIRKGIGYVKGIDLAMTELRKVTDETEASYSRFLKTASKTAGVIGSTVSDFTDATANFARLGYSMDEAAKMAETAIVYRNVAD